MMFCWVNGSVYKIPCLSRGFYSSMSCQSPSRRQTPTQVGQLNEAVKGTPHRGRAGGGALGLRKTFTPEACKTQRGIAPAEPRRVGSRVRAPGQELQEKRKKYFDFFLFHPPPPPSPLARAAPWMIPGGSQVTGSSRSTGHGGQPARACTQTGVASLGGRGQLQAAPLLSPLPFSLPGFELLAHRTLPSPGAF